MVKSLSVVKQSLFMQPSSLTLYLDQRLIKSREKVQRPDSIWSYRLENKGGNPEYL